MRRYDKFRTDISDKEEYAKWMKYSKILKK